MVLPLILRIWDPVLGTFHASDILTAYGITPGFATMSTQNYYISFFNTMDPNDGTIGVLNWPKWSDGNELMHFLVASSELLKDDFRSESYDYLVAAKDSLHI
jgi:hypothetical protein